MCKTSQLLGQELIVKRAKNMSPGWSAVGGQTRSAYETGPPPGVPEPKTGLDAVSHHPSIILTVKC